MLRPLGCIDYIKKCCKNFQSRKIRFQRAIAILIETGNIDASKLKQDILTQLNLCKI